MNDDIETLALTATVLEKFLNGDYDAERRTIAYRDIEELCLRITEQRRQTHV